MTLQSSRSRLRGSWLTFVLLVAVLCLGVWAPAVGTQGAPPAPAAAGPTPAQAPGRGGTGRVGGARGPMADPAADLAPKTPYLPRAAADEQRTFMLPAGYRMELIASDPDVINPVVIEFDGHGRMYVAEMTSYMLDAEATREHDPISRISRWESTKGDGVFDRRTVFVDTLVAPRMILPLQDGVILTSETDSDELVRWSDTNGDGVADRREVVFTGIGQSGDANIEHQKAGLVWNMDNWIYTTYNPFRIRWTPAGFLREPTGPNGGQWGLASDDDGKPWFVDAGGERGPMNFQFPIHYGAFTPCPAGRGGAGARAGAPPPAPDPNCPAGMENGFEKDFAVVWPAPSIGDMQGGLNRIRMPFQNLNHFTAASGPAIFRGHRLPDDLKGQLLFPEPVGRLIRRAAIDNIEGLTQLRNVYPSAEFITAGDQLFRPVNISNAPDGTLYIADMYHGIIQERQWSGPGTYLRAKIEQYRLDTVVNHGRIWRLRYDGRPAVPATATNIGQTAIPAIAPDFAPPRMYQETPAQLVAHLSHPNGWWRDMAQRLLVLSQDKTLAPTLEGVARSSDVLVARFHALWTLEGIGALTGRFVRELMEDPHPRMRIQAIRASETLFKAGDRTLADQYRAATRDPDVNVVIQGMLTASLFRLPDAPEVIRAARANTPAKGVALIADRLLTPGPALGGGRRGGALRPDDLARLQQGSDVYQGVCFTCHGSDGQGAPSAGEAGATMAPAIAGSPRIQAHRDYVIKVLLHGLTGPVGGRTYGEVMVPMGGSSDEWVAGVASYVRTSFGNTGDLVTPADVARVRKATAGRKTPWTYDELAATLPRALDAQQWTLSASHNPGAAGGAATLRGWTSGGPQQAGMWFQIGLPQPALVTELQFDSAAAPGAAGRGGPGAPVGPPVYGAPVSYEVVTSIDGRTWSNPVASGTGTGSRTTITLPPTRARFIRLVQTGAAGNAPAWSILGLRVFEVPAPGAAR